MISVSLPAQCWDVYLHNLPPMNAMVCPTGFKTVCTSLTTPVLMPVAVLETSAKNPGCAEVVDSHRADRKAARRDMLLGT